MSRIVFERAALAFFRSIRRTDTFMESKDDFCRLVVLSRKSAPQSTPFLLSWAELSDHRPQSLVPVRANGDCYELLVGSILDTVKLISQGKNVRANSQKGRCGLAHPVSFFE